MLEELNKGFFGFWVKKFRVSFLLIALVVIIGMSSLVNIPKESSPDIKFGIISISTFYPGVNPVDMDSLITEEIEQEIKDIEGIKSINSTSGVGISNISVELNNGVDITSVMTEIKDEIDTINFPEDAEDTSVTEVSTNNSLMFQLVLYGDGSEYSNFELLQKAKKMESDLEGKSGIASIDVGGVSGGSVDASSSSFGNYEIKVNISKSKLESLGLSLQQIAATIREYNKNTPIGNYTIGDLSYDFRVQGELTSINELQNVIVRDTGTSQIKLSDIAEITKEYSSDDYKQLGLHNKTGYNYITLDFNKATGANIFSGSASAKLAIEEYMDGNSFFEGLEDMYIKDMSETIKDDYKSLSITALQTLVLVFIIILIFVGLTESIIASIILPLSFLITFTVLDTLGFSLNFLTNFSLVLTLGIAIDTIIVIIEGGSEKHRLGYSRTASILLAVRDLKGPLISGTMTTLVAFLPMMFLPGIMGKFLSFIPITVFATLLGALVLSLTVSSALFLKVSRKSKYFHSDESTEKSMGKDEKALLLEERKEKQEKTDLNWRDKMLLSMGKFYYDKLNFFIRKPVLRFASILIPFVLLIFTFVVFSPKIGFVLFPASDNNTLSLQFTGPTGIKSEALEKYVSTIDSAVSKYEEVKLFYTSISGNTITTYIELTNNLVRQSEGKKSVFEIEDLLVGDLTFLESEGLSFQVLVEEGGPPGGKAVGIGVTTNSSENISELKTVADDFEKFLKITEGTKNVSISSSKTPGQFIFSFDRNKLSNVGLSPNDILTELYSYTAGVKAGSIKSEFEDNNIVLQIKEFDTYLTPEDVSDLVIQTSIGKVRVGDYLTSSFDKSLSSIKREDTKIIINAEADVKTGFLPTDVQPKLLEFAQNYNYPDGITFIVGGENEDNAELIQSTLQSFVIALLLIFTILVLQFNSYSRPVIILYSVVLALIGVNFGLFITGNPYSMPFAIGFIALTGIVVNDAIILLDRVAKNIDRVQKNIESPTREDYIEATIGGAKTRLQPIIVTTLTTLFGVLPLALKDAFWAGLGYTIIFGLLVGSFLTLFVIPSLYYEIYLRYLGRTEISKDAPFSKRMVIIATLIFSPVGGALLIAYSSKTVKGMSTLFILAVTSGITLLALIIGQFSIPMALIIYIIATVVIMIIQREETTTWEKENPTTKFLNPWIAILLGLISLLLLLLAIVLIVTIKLILFGNPIL